jgi:hypothetical protein
MSLFSENKLCALVILVDCCLDRSKYSLANHNTTDISSKFYHICNQNGYDFQFHSIEAQISSAISCINSVNGSYETKSAKMNIGDFFITKHSNLSQTHVVFHLAAFDSSSSSSGVNGHGGSGGGDGEGQEQHINQQQSSLKKSDLSSRHPVIMGLRNILKTCINHNIQTLTFPLLLAHQMTEVRKFGRTNK